MSRNVVLAIGALLWTSFAIVTIRYTIAGDAFVPVTAAIVVTFAVTVHHLRLRMLRASETLRRPGNPGKASTNSG